MRNPLAASFGTAKQDAALPQEIVAHNEARLQAERERSEALRRRLRRIQAVNDAVDAHLRVTGTSDYGAAFAHIQRTRPELFADMHLPACDVPTGRARSSQPVSNAAAHVAAGNFNPYHDDIGRFTTSDDAVAPGQGEAPESSTNANGKRTASAYTRA